MKDLYSYLVPWLEDIDVTTWSFIFSTITITAVVYTLLFSTVCIVSFFSERFRALGDVDKLIWCAKGTKVFYFPIPVFTGFWYLLVDDTLKDDIVNGITCKDCLCCHIHARWLQPPRQYSRCSGKTSLWQPIQYSFIHSSFCPPESLQYWYNVL